MASRTTWVISAYMYRVNIGNHIGQKAFRLLSIIIVIGINAIPFQEKVAVGDQTSLKKVQEAMRAFKSSHARAITDIDLQRLATAPGIVLTFTEFAAAHKEMANLLKPSITKENLAHLILSKRASIRDLRQAYRYQRDKLDAGGGVIASEDSRIIRIFAGDKFLLDQNRKAKGFKELSSYNACRSYDGHVGRILDHLSNGQVHGSIVPSVSRENSVLPHDVLAAGMLEDSKATRGYSLPLVDLAELLARPGVLVLEDAEPVGESKCVIVTNGLFRIYLDMARDFSVVRFETWGSIRDTRGNDVYRGREMERRRDLSELHDYGNGIWLPARIDCVSYEHGKPVERETTIVESIEINKGIDDKVFTDIIPENITVSDLVRKAVYHAGADASIHGMLSEAAQAKAKQKTWFLWLNILALVVLVSIFVIRMRRKMRRVQS